MFLLCRGGSSSSLCEELSKPYPVHPLRIGQGTGGERAFLGFTGVKVRNLEELEARALDSELLRKLLIEAKE